MIKQLIFHLFVIMHMKRYSELYKPHKKGNKT